MMSSAKKIACKITDNQRNLKEEVSNLIVLTVPADWLAPWCTRHGPQWVIKHVVFLQYHEDQTVAIVKYFLVSLALFFLFAALLIFISLRALWSNSNSIHINLVLVAFCTYLTFIAGIERTEPEVNTHIDSYAGRTATDAGTVTQTPRRAVLQICMA